MVTGHQLEQLQSLADELASDSGMTRQQAVEELRRALETPIEPFGCQINEDCVAGHHHDGPCVFGREYDGMPDPHRHNPFVIGLWLVVTASIGYLAIVVVALALIGGWRPW